jgi:segregation and condensation protein B
VIGRPILYKTTRDFLLRFGLKDISELPSIEEFEKMASELADAEPMQEEIALPMETTREALKSITGANLEEEREAEEPQADGDGSALDEVPVDGRISGPPPTDDEEDPSAVEAAVQGSGERGR